MFGRPIIHKRVKGIQYNDPLTIYNSNATELNKTIKTIDVDIKEGNYTSLRFSIPYNEEIIKVAPWNIEDFATNKNDYIEQFIKTLVDLINVCKYYLPNETHDTQSLTKPYKVEAENISTIYLKDTELTHNNPLSPYVKIVCNPNKVKSFGISMQELCSQNRISYLRNQETGNCLKINILRSSKSKRPSTAPSQLESIQESSSKKPKTTGGNSKYITFTDNNGNKIRKKIFMIDDKRKVYVKKNKYVCINTYKKYYLNAS